MEAFHDVSECKTEVYFGWWLALQFVRPGDSWLLIFWRRFTFGQTTDWELHLSTETEQDSTRLLLLQYNELSGIIGIFLLQTQHLYNR